MTVAAAWLAALGLLALTLAYWAWIWFGPAPLPLPPVAPDADPVQRIADARLFGDPAQVATTASAPSSTSGDLRLMGVFAERDGRGYALFRAGARGTLLVASGEQIGSGVRVDAVRPDGVTLLEGAARRELTLRPATTADRPAPTNPSIATAKSTACTPPPNFVGPVIRLNAELLGGLASAPDNWKAMVRAEAGALTVHDTGGFAHMLGLKNGDRIERANGIALAIPDDIASTVLQPLTKNQQVLVVGTHDGKPQQWLLVNGGACVG
jgi:type II secretion system (T2SS) protein C